VVGMARRRGAWPLEFLAGDVTDARAFDGLRGVDACLYIAGPAGRFLDAPEQTLRVHMTGLVSAIEARCGTTGFVYVSSARVYGRKAGPVTEDAVVAIDPLSLDNLYDSAKRWGEAYGLWAHQRRGWPVTIVRCSNVYGPHGSAGHAVVDLARGIWRTRRVTLTGSAASTRDYCAAADAACGMLLALVVGARGRAYNIGADDRWTTARLAGHLAALAPFPVALVEPEAIEPDDLCPSISRAHIELDYTPRLTIASLGAVLLEWGRPPAPA